MIDIEAIRARWATVSSWPWQHEVDDHDSLAGTAGWLIAEMARHADDYESQCHSVASVTGCGDPDVHAAANAEAIAHAPSDIAALLTEVERLRGVES